MILKMPRQMTDDERWQAIGMLKAGMTYQDVASHFGRAKSTISDLWHKTRRTGTVQHASKRLKRRHTTARADRRVLLMVRSNPTMPATLLRLMWRETNFRCHILSADTIRRRIKDSVVEGCVRGQDSLQLMWHLANVGQYREFIGVFCSGDGFSSPMRAAFGCFVLMVGYVCGEHRGRNFSNSMCKPRMDKVYPYICGPASHCIVELH